MLYVFLVNTGNMLTLDMALTMESVQQLQETLAQEYQLPLDKQVLLISGGQSLDPQMRVCSYSAGTDTNPIFLFSKGTIESANPPITASMAQSREDKLKLQVEGLKNLPPSYSAVVARTQLALQFHEVAKDKLRICEGLVHNQHLQQQGWMAVVANLDDITSAFQQRAQVFQQNMTDFLSDRDLFVERLDKFGSILGLLDKTPLLPCLLAHDKSPTGLNPEEGDVTLMMWISRQDHRSTLQQMATQCSKVLEQFNQPVLDNMSTEIKSCLEAVSNAGMKEIKGLGERLFGLEQLLLQARKLLTEQAEMAQGLVQNQTRATNLKDPSVLPDLCLSHQQQLTVMFKKHLQLTEMSRRCEVAKEELCQNLHVRLRWVMYVEQQVSSVHGKMVVYHENLKRLRKRLEIIRQVCMTPELYATAVVEVYRRRTYDSQYKEWASRVSTLSVSEHSHEVRRRKHFAASMQHHFLNALFPGFYEMPPTFATTPPGPYDNSLPTVQERDIELLREKVPELADNLKLPSDVHFSSVTSKSRKQLSPRPLSVEIQTQTELLSRESTTPSQVVPPGRSATGPLQHQPSDIATVASEDSHLDVKAIISQGEHSEAGNDQPVQGGTHASIQRDLGQIRKLSLESSHLKDSLLSLRDDDLDANSRVLESVYKDAPFASLLPEVDSEFHSAIGSPMDESLVRKARVDQILPALVPMEENQTLKEKLEEREKFLEELEAKKMALEKKLSDSESKIGDLQNSIGSNTLKLEESQNLVETLQEVIQTHVVDLRTKCGSIKEAVHETRQQMHQEVGDALTRITEEASSLNKDLERARATAVKQAVTRLQEQYDKEKEIHIQQLSLCNQKLEDTNQRLRDLENQIKDKEASAEMMISRHQQDFEGFKAKREEEEKQMIASMKMELEIEITELELKIQKKDEEIKELKLEAHQKMKEFETQLREEKDQALQNRTDMESKHKCEIDDLEKTLQRGHVRELANFKQSSQLQMEERLESLRQTLEHEREDAVKVVQEERESRLEALRSELQSKYLEELADFKRSNQLEVSNELDGLRRSLEEEKEYEVRMLRKEMDERLEALRNESQASHEERLTEEDVRHKNEMQQVRREEEEEKRRIRAEMEDRMDALANEMRASHEKIMATQKSEYEQEFQKLTDTVSHLNEDMKKKEAQLNAKWAESIATDKTSAVLAALEKEKQEEEKRARVLRQRLDEEKQEAVRIAVEMAKFEWQAESEQIQTSRPNDTTMDSTSSSTTEMASRQQVAFNEAVAKVAASKDRKIAQLEEREKVLEEEQERMKATIEKLLTDKADLDAELRTALQKAQQGERKAQLEKQRVEEQMKGLQQSLEGSDTSDQRTGSPAELVVSTTSDGITEVTETQAQLKALLHVKEQECQTLKRQLMHIRTSSPAGRLEKVVISDISLGDLVFIYFQEDQENYMVYNVEPTLYFLHTESMAGLGLKSKGSGAPKVNWLIARIVDKEYCQAKKAQNRFKVPMGTKFYRVKAIRYDPKLEHVARK